MHSPHAPRKKRVAFTLLEMLVVFAILTLLAGAVVARLIPFLLAAQHHPPTWAAASE